MRMTSFRILPCALLLCISFISCTKVNLPEEDITNCDKLAQLHAHPFTPVTKGGQIDIAVDSLANAYYTWSGPGNYQSYAQNNTVSSYASYGHRGWYYVTISQDGCTSKTDSVFVDVKFPQGTPPCAPLNNNATFSGPVILGNQSFSYVSFGAANGGYGITGNSSNGDMNIMMSPYWITHDFEDGIYYTANSQSPDNSAIDKVFISDVNQSIYWVAEPGKPVYISHVGGKKRITFCGIQFSGDWGGTLYRTTVNAKITQP